MKEKLKPLEVKIQELKQIVESSADLTPRRLKIIYSNTEFRLKDIVGMKAEHIKELESITIECNELIDNNKAEESYNNFISRLFPILDIILAEPVLIKT